MKLSTKSTSGQTLYVKRLTRDGSVQLTDNKQLAIDLGRTELPEAIKRLGEQENFTFFD
jgi:hypothetical protein